MKRVAVMLVALLGCDADVETAMDGSEALDAAVDMVEDEPVAEDGDVDAEPPHRDDPPFFCGLEDRITELPHALAWPERGDDGAPLVRIHLQSFESGCAAEDDAIPPGESRIRFVAPYEPGAIALGDADARALMGAYGPGNPEPIATLAFLDGEASLDILGADTIVGTIVVATPAFAGCFEATRCDSRSP